MTQKRARAASALPAQIPNTNQKTLIIQRPRKAHRLLSEELSENEECLPDKEAFHTRLNKGPRCAAVHPRQTLQLQVGLVNEKL